MSKAPKDIEKYQGHYSEEGLWGKIAKVAKKAGSKVIYAALVLYYVLQDENTPKKHKAIILGALGYFILPIDLLPDFIPVVGFTDDLAALIACIKSVYECVTPQIKTKAANKLASWFTEVEHISLED